MICKLPPTKNKKPEKVSKVVKMEIGIYLENAYVVKALYIIGILIAAKIVVYLFAPLFRRIDEKVERIEYGEHAHRVIEKGIKFFVYGIALFAILQVLGISGALKSALAGAGVAGIVIGFAAKDTFSNMISGIFLLLDDPFRVGDYVEVKGIKGVVDDISIRCTSIKTSDNKVVTIPNNILANNPIINHTTQEERRISINVGVSYETDLKKVKKVIGKLLEKDERVLQSPEPQILVKDLADFSINLEVRAWIKQKYGVVATKSDLMGDIKGALDEAGIEIPYPTRVHIEKKK